MISFECDRCDKKLILKFFCKMCHSFFCLKHRLPEIHECPNIEDYKKEKVNLMKCVANKIIDL
jgi:predicted nucleic acid binding AN1-type Zn finger protein